MKRLLLIAALAAAAAGCNARAVRPWQSAEMPTHDRQHVFNAAREVLAKHFQVAEANFAAGAIETRPQVFDRSKSGTLADWRGAGGRWRRTAYFEIDRAALEIRARVAVRLEREETAAAVAITEARSDARESELPRVGPRYNKPPSRPSDEVWVEVGYDAPLARELLSAIAQRAGQLEQGDRTPDGQSPKEAADEARRLGAEINR
jgi:hypothetical protein